MLVEYHVCSRRNLLCPHILRLRGKIYCGWWTLEDLICTPGGPHRRRGVVGQTDEEEASLSTTYQTNMKETSPDLCITAHDYGFKFMHREPPCQKLTWGQEGLESLTGALSVLCCPLPVHLYYSILRVGQMNTAVSQRGLCSTHRHKCSWSTAGKGVVVTIITR